METETTTAFKLPTGRKVSIVPVRRKSEWLPKGNEAEFLFGESYFEVIVPRREVGGALFDPLTSEERDYFENKEASGLDFNPGDLGIHRKKDNYWNAFRVKLKDETRVLDLSDPMDYIRYKVLLTDKDSIAPSWEKRFSKGTYKFALVEEGQREEAEVNETENLAEAYVAFSKMKNSATKMTNFLNVYYSTRPGSKRVPSNATKEFLVAEIGKIIKSELREFLAITKDADYDNRVFVQTALRVGAVVRKGNAYALPEGGIIGTTIPEVIAYVKNDLNNDEVLKIKARIEASK